MKIKFQVSMNIVGCNRSEVMEVDDDSTDEQIDEMLQDWMWNHVDCGWSKV